MPLENMIEQLVVEKFKSIDVVLYFLRKSLVVVLVDCPQLLVQVAYVSSRHDKN